VKSCLRHTTAVAQFQATAYGAMADIQLRIDTAPPPFAVAGPSSQAGGRGDGSMSSMAGDDSLAGSAAPAHGSADAGGPDSVRSASDVPGSGDAADLPSLPFGPADMDVFTETLPTGWALDL